jgi:hypothetical protein
MVAPFQNWKLDSAPNFEVVKLHQKESLTQSKGPRKFKQGRTHPLVPSLSEKCRKVPECVIPRSFSLG